MMDVEGCLEKGLLKKITPDMRKSKNSVNIAEKKLIEAKKIFEAEIYNTSLIVAYTVMFHSARALTFKDGIKERSHYCLCRYVKEKYNGVIEAKYLNEFNVIRDQRHNVLYGNEDVEIKKVEKEEAESAIELAGGFLEAVKKLINKRG